LKLALGTAQFGLKYGIANRRGEVSLSELAGILQVARASGIQTLDTAIAYGDAEQKLGEAGVGDCDVVSKLSVVPADCRDVTGWVVAAASASLSRLKVQRLYALLLHHPQQLLEPGGIALYRSLRRLKADGVVLKIGVSVYDPNELNELFGRYELDLVQAPFNVLDRRFLDTGWLARLSGAGTELHVRSVFLQGLLLMNRSERPPAFNRWAPLWDKYEQWIGQTGLTALQACLRYALSFPEISKVIIGVDDADQLRAAIDASFGPAPRICDALGTDELELLNPARWPKTA
jgi:aryl-alcohol dehydrogenase-like predicted oxidoreductase